MQDQKEAANLQTQISALQSTIKQNTTMIDSLTSQINAAVVQIENLKAENTASDALNQQYTQ